MKVALVSGNPLSVRGGAEIYVHRIAKSLQRRGHDTVVITTRPYEGITSLVPKNDTYDGITIWRFFPLNVAHVSVYEQHSLPIQAGWRLLDAANLHAAAAISWVLTQEQPDVVHTNNLDGISTLTGQISQRRGIRHVHTLHDYNLVCPNSNPRLASVRNAELRTVGNHPFICAVFSRLQRFLFGVPDTVIGPSRDVIDEHRAHGFFRTTVCVLLRHGVERVVDEVPPPPAAPTVLFAGRLTKAKGVETVLTAARRRPDITFHICGTGPYERAVLDAAVQLDNVRYHGFLSQSELETLRQASTVAVVPSLVRETAGLVIIEAFAQGLPVIASDIGGFPELIEPGVTGALFPPGDVDAFLAMTDEVLGRDLQTLKENARRWATHYTLDDHTDRLIDVYTN
ncbi:glycosyltransferase [Natrononativus amylolyticus]|uniref:glycosyltransferase n=1 Tax=Natrononativus amylolyticus TaxID=2963434 RepID=UPI0020CDD582|nr:glycosyltransferase [Natrononativus amylolyticus]